jgi:tetratricopeptide (TPR) repeat protein
VTRTGRWVTTVAISAGMFALAWWICLLLGQHTDVSLGVAGAATAVVLAPLAWWAGRERESGGQQAQSVQTVSGGIVIGAGSTVTIRDDDIVTASSDPLPAGSDPDVDLNDLPISLMSQIIGRDAELGQLRALLSDESVSVVSMTGFGGIGKSALVEAFLTSIAPEYGGAGRVFGWHFYSQEERGSIVSNASLFWERALRFFGYHGELPVREAEKAHALLRLLHGQRVILILDGIEALQNPPHISDGMLTDSAVQGFLVSVARDGLRGGGGLVITTSRQAVVEFGQFSGVRSVELGALDPDSGVKLLRAQGVVGADADIRHTVADYRGHPLSLVLLAKILVTDYHGDILQRFNIELLGTHIQDNVNAILTYYQRAFSERDPELVYMYFFSIVRRAMSHDELAELTARSTIGQSLLATPESRLNRAISNLKNYGLIVADDSSYDTHALIRSYFCERFQRTREREFIQVHEVLFSYFSGLPNDVLPSGMEALEPLYRAVYHGCMAGKYADALQVYWKRISRERAFYSQKELGAFSSDLAAIVPYFPDGWDRPVTDGLSDEQRAWLLGLAAFLLTGLGRLTEALRPRYAGIERFEALGDLRMACSDLRNLATLLIPLGRLAEALEVSEHAIRLAGTLGDGKRRGEFSAGLDDTELRVSAAVRKATVLHLAGRTAEADDLFRRAEEEQGSVLDRANGFYFGQLLTDTAASGETLRDVIRRGEQNLRTAERRNNLGDIGYANLTLGTVYLRLGESTAAGRHLDQAVVTLRQANRVDRLPVALIERARHHRGEWLRSGSESQRQLCQADMDEAYQQISFSRMHLFRVDLQILQAELFEDSEQRTAALELVRDAILPGIQSTGYQLRTAAVTELRQRLEG